MMHGSTIHLHYRGAFYVLRLFVISWVQLGQTCMLYYSTGSRPLESMIILMVGAEYFVRRTEFWLYIDGARSEGWNNADESFSAIVLLTFRFSMVGNKRAKYIYGIIGSLKKSKSTSPDRAFILQVGQACIRGVYFYQSKRMYSVVVVSSHTSILLPTQPQLTPDIYME